MLRAENYIDLEALRRWTQTWDERQYIDYFENQISDWEKRFKVRSSMEENIVKIKKICRDLGSELTYYSYLQLLNRIVFNCYFKQGNSALRIANFYEEIILPADQETRLKMFAYRAGKREVGSLNLEIKGHTVGQLGEQSDMFHLVYDACFLTEDELFDEGQTVVTERPNHPSFSVTSVDDDYLTLKIWKPEVLDVPLNQFVDLFLYHCSTRLNLNFKRTLFDPPFEKKGAPVQMNFTLHPVELESLPLLYFNSAVHNLPPQIRYLTYWHAILYFRERATDLVLREKMQDLLSASNHPGQAKRILKSLESLRETFSERETLDLVLNRALSAGSLNAWLDEEPRRREWFCHSHPRYSALPVLQQESELSGLSERLWLIHQCLEASAEENGAALPELDENLLLRELPLMKFLAARVIEFWSVVPTAKCIVAET